ncbi:hypothetical protein L0669_03420 [Flavobacterium bizetiae]|uniref:hypothetical protein n=1 Tax=Flavobacterium bizetiae TaxID=2704140 RepID=UPI0021E71D12|nr:hypothetical protein [Flavobacterium bizetiae]UTN04955.1 hypothetical protein L0669_03420 [Flavobacterium bizetiae]
MNKHLKYLLSLFLVFAMIASDGTLDSQSKSADYYQSSFVVLRSELDFANSWFYIFKSLKSTKKTLFLIPLIYLQLKSIFSFQIKIALQFHKLLYQNLTSFISQSVFVNEVINSKHLYKSLYNA